MYPFPTSVSAEALLAFKDDVLQGSSPFDAASRHALWEVVGVILSRIDHSAFATTDEPGRVLMVEAALGDRGIIGNGRLLKLVPYIIEIVKLFK